MSIHLPTKAAIVAVLSDTAYFLGIVGGMSYELGALGDIFPPKAKAYITAAGIGSGYFLKLVQRAMERVQGIQDASNIAKLSSANPQPDPITKP